MSQLIPLDHFGFLKISGVDAVNFLQGYTTCDLAALNDETALLGAVCNIQGRMLASFIATRQGQDLLLRMPKVLVPITMAFLSKYIVFSKAELSDISEDFHCYGSLTPEAKATQSPYPVSTEKGHIRINLGNREEQWRPAVTTPVSDNVKRGPEQWTDAELDAGTVWVNEDTSEAYLPQMLNYHQQGGISFTKGCYLGQEIVARMQYRGELKKRLHRIDESARDRNLTTGGASNDIVLSGTQACLAVLSNPTEKSVVVTWDDGTEATAFPLGPAADLELTDQS